MRRNGKSSWVKVSGFNRRSVTCDSPKAAGLSFRAPQLLAGESPMKLVVQSPGVASLEVNVENPQWCSQEKRATRAAFRNWRWAVVEGQVVPSSPMALFVISVVSAALLHRSSVTGGSQGAGRGCWPWRIRPQGTDHPASNPSRAASA